MVNNFVFFKKDGKYKKENVTIILDDDDILDIRTNKYDMFLNFMKYEFKNYLYSEKYENDDIEFFYKKINRLRYFVPNFQYFYGLSYDKKYSYKQKYNNNICNYINNYEIFYNLILQLLFSIEILIKNNIEIDISLDDINVIDIDEPFTINYSNYNIISEKILLICNLKEKKGEKILNRFLDSFFIFSKENDVNEESLKLIKEINNINDKNIKNIIKNVFDDKYLFNQKNIYNNYFFFPKYNIYNIYNYCDIIKFIDKENEINRNDIREIYNNFKFYEENELLNNIKLKNKIDKVVDTFQELINYTVNDETYLDFYHNILKFIQYYNESISRNKCMRKISSDFNIPNISNISVSYILLDIKRRELIKICKIFKRGYENLNHENKNHFKEFDKKINYIYE